MTCETYENLNSNNKCVHKCAGIVVQIYDIEKQKCVACPTFPLLQYTRIGNICACVAGAEMIQESPIKCAKCKKDMFKPSAGNEKCKQCENYELSTSNNQSCINKCSESGLLTNRFLTDEDKCETCHRNMIVKQNVCKCIPGFIEVVALTGVECVQEKGTKAARKQSEIVAVTILVIIFVLHAIGITWYIVNKCYKNAVLKSQGIKSA
ncbi:Cysteine-rich membrane protein 2 [Spironucleus salmonicida]|uniref:Cysteine-rich membrane protein 2 n=1 Tax=Spironucleus salmonicida TaxID=348837 RepID=V6LTS9_9EUKA|nr:Cysteine-rich membrane protein 2 [Spironucleus salmonicida]|eukprot:EST47116.1 Cysteine-rich membrane protein 2 [Spironucleus salmonicida]